MRSTVILFALASLFVGLPGSVLAASKPNVLFISVDDMNDWVGCLGSDRVPTPNIDALAQRGLLFTNAHAPSPKCAPSRAAILTGTGCTATAIGGNRVSPTS